MRKSFAEETLALKGMLRTTYEHNLYLLPGGWLCKIFDLSMILMFLQSAARVYEQHMCMIGTCSEDADCEWLLLSACFLCSCRSQPESTNITCFFLKNMCWKNQRSFKPPVLNAICCSSPDESDIIDISSAFASASAFAFIYLFLTASNQNIPGVCD